MLDTVASHDGLDGFCENFPAVVEVLLQFVPVKLQLAKDRMVANVKDGDFLALMSAGAYCYVMSSNYNVRGRGPEIIVRGNRFAITKPRQVFEDLVRGETIPGFIK